MALGILAGLVLAAAQPRRSPAHEAPIEQTCLTIERGWSGSTADRQHIATTPVPDSLKRIWLGHDCEAWSLDRTSLLEWHLKFGTPDTTAAALSWVESAFLEQLDPVEKFQKHAAEDLKAARKGSKAATDRTNRRAEDFAAYGSIAEQYMRAAEFFHSPKLLEKAKPYVDAVDIGLDLFEPANTVGLATDNRSPEWDVNLSSSDINPLRELRPRFAVEQAYQTGSAEDIAAAQKLLDQTPGGPEMMVYAGDQIVRSDGDPCSGNAAAAPVLAAALTKACESENDLAGRVERYWRDRAMLDQVIARTSKPLSAFGFTPSLELATEILRTIPRYVSNLSGRLEYTPQKDEEVGLLLAAGDAGIACAHKHGGHAESCEPGALNSLVAAEEIVSPVVNLNRFRQIAGEYSRYCQAIAGEQWDSCEASPLFARQAAYLRLVADHLDELDNSESQRSSAVPTETGQQSR